jgi:FtsZ-binding cell division protein ZapB
MKKEKMARLADL